MTIRIKPLGDAMESFRKAFKAAENAPQTHAQLGRREGVYFTSIEAARKLLTPNRLALLRKIRTERPVSICALARSVGRNLKNVQQDLQLLESYGLVRMARNNSTPRRGSRAKAPRALFAEIALKIAI